MFVLQSSSTTTKWQSSLSLLFLNTKPRFSSQNKGIDVELSGIDSTNRQKILQQFLLDHVKKTTAPINSILWELFLKPTRFNHNTSRQWTDNFAGGDHDVSVLVNQCHNTICAHLDPTHAHTYIYMNNIELITRKKVNVCRYLPTKFCETLAFAVSVGFSKILPDSQHQLSCQRKWFSLVVIIMLIINSPPRGFIGACQIRWRIEERNILKKESK